MIRQYFEALARRSSAWFGSAMAFFLAVSSVTIWAISGPFFGFSDQWSLAINTGTTIVTFLMVFLVQATQNRDSAAVHLKLDELIRASNARNMLISLEERTEADVVAVREEVHKEISHGS